MTKAHFVCQIKVSFVYLLTKITKIYAEVRNILVGFDMKFQTYKTKFIPRYQITELDWAQYGGTRIAVASLNNLGTSTALHHEIRRIVVLFIVQPFPVPHRPLRLQKVGKSTEILK
jgi:hypothetical protein